MFTKSKWIQGQEQVLCAESLELLVHNQIPAIRIPAFASLEECQSLVEAIRKNGFQFYENTQPPIGRIGITQYEFRDQCSEGKPLYFEAAKAAIEARKRICNLSFDPLERLIEQLSSVASLPVGIAQEDQGETYFAGLIRQINRSALIHADFACFDAPDWNIGRIASQLSWNLFIYTPESGGECIVHNRQWGLHHERQRLPNSYGYDPLVVKDVESHSITPKIGDLVIFNSRNFHEVKPAEGDRLTMSSFIGYLKDKKYVLWS